MKLAYFLTQKLEPINNPALPGLKDKTETDAPNLLGNLIAGLIGIMLTFATLLALAQLLQGGIQWITSGGDKGGIEGARDRIINALMGLVIVFAAWSLYLLILHFLGIDLLGSNGTFHLTLPSLMPSSNP